ncbi:MAG: ABC transporter ATP-binding protein/permease [Chloroflexota bacterium]|nr:ABC transporter ATP-binding protein/permease [Chloroflexota bacterium]
MLSDFQSYWSLLRRYLSARRRLLSLLAMLLFGTIALQLVKPQLLRYFIDTSQARGSQAALLGAAILFLVAATAQRLAEVGTTYVGESVGWHATNQLRADLAAHLLNLDLDFHKAHTPGELIERVDGDVTALANFFSQLTVRILGNLILMLAILLLLFREDSRVGVALALYIVATLVGLRLIQSPAVRRWVIAREAQAAQLGFLEERLAGTEDIRANGATDHVMHQLLVLMRRVLHAERRAELMRTVTYGVTHVTYASAFVAGLGIGASLYLRGQISIGTVYLITAYVGLLAQPIEAIRGQIDDLQKASASVGRISRLFELEPRVVEQRAPVALPRETGRDTAPSLAFHNVSFSYEGQDTVLHNVTFNLAPGRVLGLLGRTGSGKSTLTRLLFRLYDPTAGTIALDGIDLRQLPMAELRQRVGMVTQDVQLFHATIRDNLTFWDSKIPDEQLLDTLRELGLWGWFETLPEGLDTVLHGGRELSAGEAQLLALARVFLKDPGLVILDEASSRLDPATEQRLERALDRLLVGRTAIVIAHRLATVQRADEIMVLEDGQVVEHGDRMALAAHPNSRFDRLLQTGLEEVLT